MVTYVCAHADVYRSLEILLFLFYIVREICPRCKSVESGPGLRRRRTTAQILANFVGPNVASLHGRFFDQISLADSRDSVLVELNDFSLCVIFLDTTLLQL